MVPMLSRMDQPTSREVPEVSRKYLAVAAAVTVAVALIIVATITLSHQLAEVAWPTP